MTEQNNSKVTVTMSQDELKASIILYKGEDGRAITKNEILDTIRDQGVLYGIKENVIDYLVQNPIYNESVCIAEGNPPINGQNGTVTLHFDLSSDRKPTILEDGRIDYRELNLIKCVEEGTVLCTLVEPIQGISGKTVRGKLLPAINGRPAVLPRGKHVAASQDGKSLLAAITGEVELTDDGKINVFANHEVHADVDNSTGNISFVGNVVVRGNVLSGFSIEAGGNVEVYGVVEGASIRAGGNIILRRGMQGMGKGCLISEGDIVARYIEYSNLEAARNIQAEAIMHSNVKCGNKMELTGRKGLLVGGVSRVGKEISAKVIGSHMATATELEVGINPAIRERYKKAKEELINLEADLKKADQAITLLRKLEAAGTIMPDKKDILVKSVRTKVVFSAKIEELKQEIQEMDGKLQQDVLGKIRVTNFLYPGVKVAIGSCMMYVKETLQYCTLYRDGADVRVGAIDR